MYRLRLLGFNCKITFDTRQLPAPPLFLGCFLMSRKMNFLSLTLLVLATLFFGSPYSSGTDPQSLGDIDTGDTAWMIVASAFVLLMTPGLAFFYGGMVNKKNVISTMLQSFVALGVISVLWVFVGFSLCFGESVGVEPVAGAGFMHPRTFVNPLIQYASLRKFKLPSASVESVGWCRKCTAAGSS